LKPSFREVAAYSGVDENLPTGGQRHFLGALTGEGKYDSKYGHPERSRETLMHVHHIGKKIPYFAVTKFNYGYR
jgi:hypothetical protein